VQRSHDLEARVVRQGFQGFERIHPVNVSNQLVGFGQGCVMQNIASHTVFHA
jgi:hypothetical protein